MRIGIDTFSLDRPGGNYGVGRGLYAWNLLPELFAQAPHHEFVVFANRENAGLIPRPANVEVVVSRLPTHPRPWRIWHEQVELWREYRRRRLDVLHCLGNDTCFLLGRRVVLTVYDLMWKWYLERDCKPLKYRFFALTVPRSLRRCGMVAAISRFIADEVQTEYDLPPERVRAVPLAAPALLEPGCADLARLEEKYDFPFVFTLTTCLPHKNLSTLLQAFAGLQHEEYADLRLVVAGQLKGDFHLTVQEEIVRLGLQRRVVLSGFIGEEEKTYLYRHARLFVFPSLYEGFGLPILEAMRCGVPVAAARAASLPEVGGDACRYFPPRHAAELQAVMSEILGNPALAREFGEAGRRRAKEFTWRRTAAATLALYEESVQARAAGESAP